MCRLSHCKNIVTMSMKCDKRCYCIVTKELAKLCCWPRVVYVIPFFHENLTCSWHGHTIRITAYIRACQMSNPFALRDFPCTRLLCQRYLCSLLNEKQRNLRNVNIWMRNNESLWAVGLWNLHYSYEYSEHTRFVLTCGTVEAKLEKNMGNCYSIR